MKTLLLTTALALSCGAAFADDAVAEPGTRYTDPAKYQTIKTLAAQGNKKAQAGMIAMLYPKAADGSLIAYGDRERGPDTMSNSRVWEVQSAANANFEARVATYGYAARPAK